MPAPKCLYCGKRIGYNQRDKQVKIGTKFAGWRHERCTEPQNPRQYWERVKHIVLGEDE